MLPTHSRYVCLSPPPAHLSGSGSVINNPHGYGVHGFAGAYPPTTYHWRRLGPANPPLVNASAAVKQYYGSNVYVPLLACAACQKWGVVAH
jgi:hypothetical protein